MALSPKFTEFFGDENLDKAVLFLFEGIPAFDSGAQLFE